VQKGTYNRCVKIDQKFANVWEKMSENPRFFWLTLYKV